MIDHDKPILEEIRRRAIGRRRHRAQEYPRRDYSKAIGTQPGDFVWVSWNDKRFGDDEIVSWSGERFESLGFRKQQKIASIFSDE